MASRDVLKVSALHYKDPNRTDEEFEKWFHEELNPDWLKLVNKHGVMKYTVTFCPSELSAGLVATVDKVRPGWTVLGSHAVLTYWVRDIQHMMLLTSDPEYKTLGRDAEAGWIDSTKGEIMVGYERIYIENSKIVDETATN